MDPLVSLPNNCTLTVENFSKTDRVCTVSTRTLTSRVKHVQISFLSDFFDKLYDKFFDKFFDKLFDKFFEKFFDKLVDKFFDKFVDQF